MFFYLLFLLFIPCCHHLYGYDIYKSIRTVEKDQAIPSDLLWSIACVESGRSNNKIPIQPWPWTINVQKKGYFFKNKQDCLKAIKCLIKKGYQSIDVGCMQINLKYHPHAFSSIEDALDIQKNITYGAKFLKSLFKKYKNWHMAIAHYHSSKAHHHRSYQKKVMDLWKKSTSHPNQNPIDPPKNNHRIFHLFESPRHDGEKRCIVKQTKKYISLFKYPPHQINQRKFFPIKINGHYSRLSM